jgi:hypothetical protein
MSEVVEDACDPFRMRVSSDRVTASHELFGAYARSVIYLQPALREAVVLGKTEDRIGKKKPRMFWLITKTAYLCTPNRMIGTAIRPEDL